MTVGLTHIIPSWTLDPLLRLPLFTYPGIALRSSVVRTCHLSKCMLPFILYRYALIVTHAWGQDSETCDLLLFPLPGLRVRGLNSSPKLLMAPCWPSNEAGRSGEKRKQKVGSASKEWRKGTKNYLRIHRVTPVPVLLVQTEDFIWV